MLRGNDTREPRSVSDLNLFLNTYRDNPSKRRDVFKFIMSELSLGVDLSGIFQAMVKSLTTTDLVEKKMIMRYMETATTEENLAMAVSALQNDLKSLDPQVHGLALRTLASFRCQGSGEYHRVLEAEVFTGLDHSSSYVRRIACGSTVRLADLRPELRDSIEEKLYKLLEDRDTSVVVSSAMALRHIAGKGVLTSKKVVNRFVNVLPRLGPTQKSVILSLIAEYVPETANEAFQVMNHIDQYLYSTDTGVLLSAAQVFVNIVSGKVADLGVRKMVYERLRGPLVTHLLSAGPELAFVILRHIHFLIHLSETQTPGINVFGRDYAFFVPSPADPPYVVGAKVDILTDVISPDNHAPIIHHVLDLVYAGPIDLSVAESHRKAGIRGIEKIAVWALGLGDSGKPVYDRICGEMAKIASFLAAVDEIDLLYDLLEIVVSLDRLDGGKMLAALLDEEVASAVLNLCQTSRETGQYSKSLLGFVGVASSVLSDAPYILEDAIEVVWEREKGSDVKKSLLWSTARCFVARPNETYVALVDVVSKCVSDRSPDVSDVGKLFYKLLENSIDLLPKILSAAPERPLARFSEYEHAIPVGSIGRGFNTLSVVYMSPYERVVNGRIMDDDTSESESEEESPFDESRRIEPKRFQKAWVSTREALTVSKAVRVDLDKHIIGDLLKQHGINVVASGSTAGNALKFFCYSTYRERLFLVQLVFYPQKMSVTVKSDPAHAKEISNAIFSIFV